VRRKRDAEAGTRARKKRPDRLDRFDLYERAVTSPERLARFLQAVHGKGPRVLGEDFSGTAALARAWVRLGPRHRAVAVDKDPAALARAKGDRVHVVRRDVMQAKDRCDVIAATNFPICYWHSRATLIAYLGHVRSRLKPRGVFAADLYGGSDAFKTGSKVVRHRRDGRIFEYTWEQREADPISGRVLNAIHFRTGGRTLRDAFVYDWRLWSIPELSEAMSEVGFQPVDVYDSLGDAIDQRGNAFVRPATRLDDPFVVYVVGRLAT
jgi:SAM-dependent methyltransferase